MRRVIQLVICSIILFQASQAYVMREIILEKEKNIEIIEESDEDEVKTTIDIGNLTNPRIVKKVVDNGEIEAKLKDDLLIVNLYDGEYTSTIKKVKKSTVLSFEDLPLTSESGRTIKITPDKKVVEIEGCTGDFESAQLNTDGSITVKIRNDATGIDGIDTDNTEESLVKVEVDKNNRDRIITTEWVKTDYQIIGIPHAVSEDTSEIQDIYVDEDSVKVLFADGSPTLNETSKNVGYVYCWIDRDINGEFRKYIPNSVYKTDKKSFSGTGEYLTADDEPDIITGVSSPDWVDYVGAKIDGTRYVSVFDKNVELYDVANQKVVNGDSVILKKQEMNTEKYTVSFSEAGVSYEPEGKLYSMGDLVSNTKGWGEIYPNHSWESTESFYNSLTGKYETYVKHFKFFYGPKAKTAFGGYFTYPYSCTLKYKHYKPIKLFSGEIECKYEKEQKVTGYYYDGYVKLRYDSKGNVKDFPPTAPYNVKLKDKILSWEAATDDYTPKNALLYEVQQRNSEWETIGINTGGIVTILVPNIENGEFRVRTLDETGQFSEWAELEDSKVSIKAKILPNMITAGDNINLYAIVKSNNSIEKVTAESDETQMHAELRKISESIPTFKELSFDIDGVFNSSDTYLATSNSRVATSEGGGISVSNFFTEMVTEGDVADVKLPEGLSLKERGSIIFAGQNYLNSPTDFFRYNGKYWFLHLGNQLQYKNLKTDRLETLIEVRNTIATERIDGSIIRKGRPIVRVNNFEFANGNAGYYEIDIEKSDLDKPVAITWNTDVYRDTEFEIFIGEKKIATFIAEWKSICENVGDIAYYNIEKRLQKHLLSGYGFFLPSSKRQEILWTDILPSIAIGCNPNELPWLGYKIRKGDYLNQAYMTDYNRLSTTRATNRLLFVDERVSEELIKNYMKIIRTTNTPIKRQVSTVLADDIIERTTFFELKELKTSENIENGAYSIKFVALDDQDNKGECESLLKVDNDETQMYPEEEPGEEPEGNDAIISKILVGRIYLEDDEYYIEELKKPLKINDSEGFICAGETLGVMLEGKNIKYIDVGFREDKSITEFDELTQMFLGKNSQNKELEGNYKFPQRVYSEKVDNLGINKLLYTFVIPYKTSQTLESWRTLKKGSLENIDVTRVLDRRREPYVMNIKINGDKNQETEIKFDVFERWDTVLNRNIKDYLLNANTYWSERVKNEEE